MAVDLVRENPTYLATELPSSTTHAVIVPAWRWRALMEFSSITGSDPLLVAVLQLRDAGCGLRQISDMLQLPYDLIEYLGLRAAKERYEVNGQTVTRTHAEVGWVYRDVLTDELVPASGKARPPLALRGGGKRVRFRIGTTGSPTDIHCVVLHADKPPPAPPSPVDLARLRKGDDTAARISLVGDGEACLLVHPATAQGTELMIVGHGGEPQLALTRVLHERSPHEPVIREWMADALAAHASSSESPQPTDPLHAAAITLAQAGRAFRANRDPSTAETLKRRILLGLGRYCAEAWYRAGIDPHATPQPEPTPRDLASAFGLPEEVADRLVNATGSAAELLNRDAIRLLIDTRRLPTDFTGVDAPGLARAASELTALLEADTQHERLERLRRETADLIDGLLKPREEIDGIQGQ